MANNEEELKKRKEFLDRLRESTRDDVPSEKIDVNAKMPSPEELEGALAANAGKQVQEYGPEQILSPFSVAPIDPASNLFGTNSPAPSSAAQTLKQNSIASTGVNPNVPTDQPSDSDEGSKEDNNGASGPVAQRSPASLIAKLQSLKANPTPNPAPIGDTLSKLLGTSDDKLKAAQEQASTMRLLAMLGEAGDTVSRGLAPMAHLAPNTEFYKQALENANSPVANIQQAAKNKEEQLNNVLKQGQATTEMNQVDPNSAVSGAMRDLYEKEIGKKADPSMSYADIARLEPSLARIFNASESAKNRANALAQVNATHDNKLYDDISKQVTNISRDKAAQNANETLRRIAQADQLLNVPTDKLNAMNPRMVQLATNEIAAISMGGNAPGHAEIIALAPPHIRAQIAAGIEAFTNHQSPQNAAAFLKPMADYLRGLKETNKRVLSQRAKRIVGGSRLSDQMKRQLLEQADRPEYYDYGQAEDQGSNVPNMSPNQPSSGSKESSKAKPGDIILHNGKRYKVGTDGDSLESL